MGAAARAAILTWALPPAAFVTPAVALSGDLVRARDLAAESREAAASGRALVVLFSISECPWYERLRAEVRGPMQRSSDHARRMLVREIEIDGNRTLLGFCGERTTHAAVASAHRSRFVPVEAFSAPGGAETPDSPVGFRTAERYGSHLDRRIGAAQSRVPRH